MRAPQPCRTGLLIVLWLALVAAASAAPLYQVVEIGVLDGTPGNFNDSSAGLSVNNAGQATGVISVNFVSYGVIYQNGVLSYLGTKSGALRRSPNRISGNGIIAGSSSSQGFTFQGAATRFSPPNRRFFCVNDSGVFCGSSGNFAASGSGTTLTPILPATGQPAFEGGGARAINNAGQIVGEFNRAPAGTFKTGFYRKRAAATRS